MKGGAGVYHIIEIHIQCDLRCNVGHWPGRSRPRHHIEIFLSFPAQIKNRKKRFAIDRDGVSGIVRAHIAPENTLCFSAVIQRILL